MPLLEQFYFPDPPLFATSSIDPRNDALLIGGEDTVTIKGVICAQSIIPLYSGGQPNGAGSPGAQLDAKYRPCETLRVVGWNTAKGYAISGSPFLPVPPEPAITPEPLDIDGDLAAPFVVIIQADGNMWVGSFDTFSAFFEPVAVNFTYIACAPAATENPPTTPSGIAAGAPGPFGVRKVSR